MQINISVAEGDEQSSDKCCSHSASDSVYRKPGVLAGRRSGLSVIFDDKSNKFRVFKRLVKEEPR